MSPPNAIVKTLQRACTMADLRNGMERTAEVARLYAGEKFRYLGVLCARYSAHMGNTAGSYAEISRSAHVAAYYVMTYGEVCDALHMLEPGVCLSIMESGRLMQERAHSQEALQASNALSPAAVFYDDLFDVWQLEIPLRRANLRFDLLAGADLSNQLQPDMRSDVGTGLHDASL